MDLKKGDECDSCVHFNVKLGYCWGWVFHDWCEYKSLEEEYKKNTPSSSDE
jgi:hypothetical protein